MNSASLRKSLHPRKQRDKIRLPFLHMNRLAAKPFRVARWTRFALAIFLLAGFLLSIAPPAAVSAGSACALACCAGRAPHEAGSCMNGSCHAVLKGNRRKQRHRIASNPQERLCGVSGKLDLRTRVDLSSRSTSAPVEQARRSTTLTKPCLPECGASVARSSNSNQRNATVVSDCRPRPPIGLVYSRCFSTHARLLQAVGQESAPRGPPLVIV